MGEVRHGGGVKIEIVRVDIGKLWLACPFSSFLVRLLGGCFNIVAFWNDIVCFAIAQKVLTLSQYIFRTVYRKFA